jgi:nicotinamidase-related amidase
MKEYNVPLRESVALLTIDLQRDFAVGYSPVRSSGVSHCLPNIRDLIGAFRARSAPIFHAVRLYRPDGSNVELHRRAAVEEGLRVLMPGTRGAELIDEVAPGSGPRLDPESLLAGEFETLGANEHVFYKPRWGAFYATGLRDKLEALGITTLVICGCNFPTGGRASVYEACAQDFRVIVASDAVCDASEEGLGELCRLGVYQRTTASCLDWLRGCRHPDAA